MDYVGGGCESEAVPLCLLNLHFPGGSREGAGRARLLLGLNRTVLLRSSEVGLLVHAYVRAEKLKSVRGKRFWF